MSEDRIGNSLLFSTATTSIAAVAMVALVALVAFVVTVVLLKMKESLRGRERGDHVIERRREGQLKVMAPRFEVCLLMMMMMMMMVVVVVVVVVEVVVIMMIILKQLHLYLFNTFEHNHSIKKNIFHI